MKKLKLTGKLSLNKETISRLNENEMDAVKGGDLVIAPPTKILCSKLITCDKPITTDLKTIAGDSCPVTNCWAETHPACTP